MEELLVGRTGSLTIDFDNDLVQIDRGGALAETAGFVSMQFKISEITAIEIRRPTFLKLGAFSFIINGKRYMRTGGQFDNTEFALNNKNDFAKAEEALKRVIQQNNLGDFKPENSVNAEKEIYQAPVGKDCVFNCTNNTNSTLCVYPDYVTLKHSGVLNALSKSGAKGEKRILYSAITAVEYKKATTIAPGFIQFSISGADRGGGNLSAAADENSIIFDVSKNQLTQQIVDYIENRRIEISKPQVAQVVQQSSALDEIKKLKELLDMGVISQDEFDAKKKQLLGL